MLKTIGMTCLLINRFDLKSIINDQNFIFHFRGLKIPRIEVIQGPNQGQDRDLILAHQLEM